jgi:hypothetical protein
MSSLGGTVTTISNESPPEECADGSQAAALTRVAHSLALAIQWANVQCSFGLCDEYEPSKIWK